MQAANQAVHGKILIPDTKILAPFDSHSPAMPSF